MLQRRDVLDAEEFAVFQPTMTLAGGDGKRLNVKFAVYPEPSVTFVLSIRGQPEVAYSEIDEAVRAYNQL